MKTVVTTAGRPTLQATEKARAIAINLQYPFVERKKRSVKKMQQSFDAHLLVIGNDRYEYFLQGMEEPFFFHPNLAMVRLKRLLQGQQEPLAAICALQEGDRFLDCTLGLGADSIIAAHLVGEKGRVLGLEANKNLAFITANGLQQFQSNVPELIAAMQRIEVQQAEAKQYLATLPDSSWDIVYIDPMFHEPIDESNNFTVLREVGEHHILTAEWMAEAFRVCKRAVVVKDVYTSPVFAQFNLERDIRPNIKFHYGILRK